jgi:predicted nucleic acid-binding protein
MFWRQQVVPYFGRVHDGAFSARNSHVQFLLTLADGLGIHSVSNRTLWQGALVRAHEANVAVYDTMFVELAVREQAPLATFDSGVLKAFPSIAVRPGRLLRK